ncbi:hypothetical protein DFP72DRAFT_860320 [Ephemerocybe angulata]|uniref:Uncharacterized protein n=1 Tax=Ephemerocybe angulata TaxID=980116 RepID=A0A8H6LSX9_9AGAR|nr:hypothetical protein DFP72DRAFT_860320 [Tulosesus angulatus]
MAQDGGELSELQIIPYQPLRSRFENSGDEILADSTPTRTTSLTPWAVQLVLRPGIGATPAQRKFFKIPKALAERQSKTAANDIWDDGEVESMEEQEGESEQASGSKTRGVPPSQPAKKRRIVEVDEDKEDEALFTAYIYIQQPEAPASKPGPRTKKAAPQTTWDTGDGDFVDTPYDHDAGIRETCPALAQPEDKSAKAVIASMMEHCNEHIKQLEEKYPVDNCPGLFPGKHIYQHAIGGQQHYWELTALRLRVWGTALVFLAVTCYRTGLE